MVLSGILVGLLATLGQWWFFGPITKCLVYPLTTGILTGIFMGDPMTGMLAGAHIQLIYLGWISAGGTMPSNTIVAGIFGTAMTILSGADPVMAVTFAIPFSMFGLLLNQIYMTVNSFWIHRADNMLEKGNINGVRVMNYLPSFLVALVLYGIPAFALVVSGQHWGTSLIEAIPESLVTALQVVGGIMPALGIAMLLNYLGKPKLIPWFFAGFFLAVFLRLDIMAIAIFASIISILLFLNQNQEEEKKRSRRLTLDNAAVSNSNTSESDRKDYSRKMSKKDLIVTWLFTTSSEACYNYERLQALGIANLMLTPIKKLYDTNERRVEELKKYMVFYNSEVFTCGPIINGIAVSMEEARANGEEVSAEDINSVRTGLMGPVAGIGDTVMQGILFPILAGIGCTLALDGNYMGPWLFTITFEILIFTCGYLMFMNGYKYGKTTLLTILKNGVINKVTNAFSIVGLMVVGCMAYSRVSITTPLEITVGSGTVVFQQIVDSLLPGLLPLLITLLIWKLVAKKINITYIILMIFVVGILFSYLGIFGVL